MSDDEGSYDRSSLIERYLYGDISSSSERSFSNNNNANNNAINNSNINSFNYSNLGGVDKEQTNKYRSKSQDSSRIFQDSSGTTGRELQSGMARYRTKEIERQIKWKNVQSLVNTQNNRLIDEKEELNQLNNRLDQLVESVKQKKSQNDELQEKINAFREEILFSSKNGESRQKSQLNSDLEGAKSELNNLSEVSTLAKIRASRSMYELDRLKEQFDDEIRYQTSNRDKIRLLENQRAESLHELSFLKENCESKKKSLLDDADRNERLRTQLKELSDNLDEQQEQRVDLDCQIQTLLERKKFDQELYRLMRQELDRVFLYQGEHKISDPTNFYKSELREIKEKIREDFKKLNEYDYEQMRTEYEYKYVQVVEEYEIQRKAAEEARLAAEREENMNFSSLSSEFDKNKEEIKNLKLQEFNLNKLLQELMDRLNENRVRIEEGKESKQREIDLLREQIENLKADLSSMLSFSKSLDSEVAVYARLLNQRLNNFITQTHTFETYENLVFGDEKEKQSENKRLLEENELKRKQKELEENNRRLRELEEQQRKQREEEERRRREYEEQLRIQREYEERIRIQREEEERRQRELEEERRRKQMEEEIKRQQILEEERRRQVALEEERLRQQALEEERRRLQALEEERRRQRELEEERLRQQAIEEERRRQQALEEERRRQQALEEERRRQQALEEEKRRQREIEEERRRQWELEEERRRQQVLEEERLRQLALEEERRRQQALEEEKRRQREIEEERRRQREIDEERRRQEVAIEEERRRQHALEEERRRIQYEYEEKVRIQREYEERIRVQREEEERRQRDLEEEKRKREEEERRRREHEEREKQRQREVDEERRRLKEKEEEERRRREYEEQLRVQREYEERIRIQREEEERKRQQREKEEREREEQIRIQREYEEKIRIQIEIMRQKEQEESRRKEFEEQQRRQRELEDQRRRQKEADERMKREIEEERRRQRELEEKRAQKEIEDEIKRQKQIEAQRKHDIEQQEKYYYEQKRQQQQEQQNKKNVDYVYQDYTVIIKNKEMTDFDIKQRQFLEMHKRQKEAEEQRLLREKELERERQLKLKKEREEHEKYILEKLRQEQELLEIQQRKKQLEAEQNRSRQNNVKCVDNISTYTKRIIEENHRSTEIFEEHRVKSTDCDNYEKQINIKLPCECLDASQQLKIKSESSSNLNNTNSNKVHKSIHISNVTRPQSTVNQSYSATSRTSYRSQSPPSSRNLIIANGSGSMTERKLSTTDNNTNKYAIKHKANRYVSGAIGILETSLNGEYIILENLSSNKSVNLKGWYIHRFVPDQNINVTFKFNDDTILASGEKLKILSRLASKQQIRSSSMHEGLNKPPSGPNKPTGTSRGIEKVMIANNVENWGTYSKFSVTKLINQDGVDKAVLTQSLLRLASSSNNLNTLCPDDMAHTESNGMQKHIRSNSKSSTHLDQEPCYQTSISRPLSRNCCPETVSTTTTTKKTSTTTTQQTTTTTTTHKLCPDSVIVTAKPPIVHVTRQF